MTVLATVLGVLFTLNNFDHVQVHLLMGKAVEIRVIFLIFISFGLGFIVRHFIGISREEELKRRLLLMRSRKKKDSSGDNLFDEFE
ncbi:magnetosome protein MamL [Fundidesulfovibrio magnetotacticus]|uniref:Magnetosome protein MamL n=1 Tax=Fundidesulfovibrio magnetotacticus TaxID=2730080 RepID=A0A6V8LRS0_9BACT|nr:magnetosome protein MamL [Fundidesulfovibrio magnetotacticus]